MAPGGDIFLFIVTSILVYTSHPGLAENIAPDGRPGIDIIAVRVQAIDNSWVQDDSSILHTICK